uniref:4Fe-4S ferredoxin-type domain-containing protein n=1 Tax=candidate division WOR-3 bacterium TaxID=2052148 RepID=A0A7C4CE01_UNCW3
MSREELLRDRCRQLLADGAVAMVVGWRAGSRSGTAQPCFITKPEDTAQLICDERCSQNIAGYLARVKHMGKLAVVARGCDSRSIVCLLKERQLERDRLHIIGVGCTGIRENGELSDACSTCVQPNPVLCDEMVGEATPQPGAIAKPAETGPTPDTRWQELSAEVARCIRCYACRQACPNCYCPVCFVDATQPQLVGKTTGLSDNMVFHIMRALHMAGRCVECGACSRACPMQIDLMRFNREAARIARERFGTSAGMNLEEPPALAAFDPNDPQEFIR